MVIMLSLCHCHVVHVSYHTFTLLTPLLIFDVRNIIPTEHVPVRITLIVLDVGDDMIN